MRFGDAETFKHMNSDRKASLERIFRAGIEGVRPERLIASALKGAIEGTERVPLASMVQAVPRARPEIVMH